MTKNQRFWQFFPQKLPKNNKKVVILMKIIKKIDDLGRIAIPKEIRRALRWMGGDEIEINLNDDRSISLRRHEDDTINILQGLRDNWQDDSEIEGYFIDLIEALKEKIEN